MKGALLLLVFAAGSLSLLSSRAEARVWPRSGVTEEMDCSSSHFHVDDLVSYAQMREQRLPAASTNYINPGPNGSIKVHGWNNSDVLVKACIQAAAPSESEAREMASQIAITRGPGAIEPSGPSDNRHHWSLSYEVWIPNGSNIKMEANNGSISADNVRGQIRFHTSNGSVHLLDVGGDVDGSTTNGSVNVQLEGSGWSGNGLHVETTNGSVKLELPENFSAQIQASTVNGRVQTDFPVTLSGEIGRNMDFQLGSGGPMIEARTVNGSVHIGRRS